MQETICILYPAKPLTFLPERRILAAGIVVPALPYLLSFAAGAMLYVVVEELIPEMSQGQHSNVGTVFFAVGFSVMMVLDVALGRRLEPSKAKSLSKSPKMPKLLDRGNSRAYYFGRRTAEKRLFIERKVSII